MTWLDWSDAPTFQATGLRDDPWKSQGTARPPCARPRWAHSRIPRTVSTTSSVGAPYVHDRLGDTAPAPVSVYADEIESVPPLGLARHQTLVYRTAIWAFPWMLTRTAPLFTASIGSRISEVERVPFNRGGMSFPVIFP